MVIPPMFQECNADGSYCDGTYDVYWCAISAPDCSSGTHITRVLSGARNPGQSFKVWFTGIDAGCSRALRIDASATGASLTGEAEANCYGYPYSVTPGEITGTFTTSTLKLVLRDVSSNVRFEMTRQP
jgi:hypothetical protein